MCDLQAKATKEHKKKAPVYVSFGIITLSDTRTLEDDDSGKLIRELFEKEGHQMIEHRVIPDDIKAISDTLDELLKKGVDVIVTNGGTGISPKDVTIEAIKHRFEKEISGFNPLFMMLGYNDVGAPAMLSRATAGLIGKSAVFCLPGNPKAVRLGVEKLILPEIGHIIKHIGD